MDALFAPGKKADLELETAQRSLVRAQERVDPPLTLPSNILGADQDRRSMVCALQECPWWPP